MKEFLDNHVLKANCKEFIVKDPVQFVHKYSLLEDIEIVAFCVATISWGRREIILRDAKKMLEKMGKSPYNYVMNKKYEELGVANIHRTFFENDLAYLLRGLHKIYLENNNFESFIKNHNIKNPWEITELVLKELYIANYGKTNSRNLFSVNYKKSALKRLNMALRWLVRKDGIVDLGVWTFLSPSNLYIPLDVHVANTSRKLGLLKRNSNDRQSVEELTHTLRKYCEEDPVKYDFALFSIGESKETLN